MEYTKDNPLRVFTAFSGYDSQCLALKRLAIPFDLVGWSEIDKYAIQAHDVLFPEYKYRNYGDISKIDWGQVPDFDLFTYSFPCTNLSFAGKQEGFDEGSGTASSLLWECRNAIVTKKPKYLVMENVKALVSAKFKPLFMKWQSELASYGYTNFVKVLDSSQFGVPQHRERVFMVSILDENASFHFPEPFPLEKKLKDVLESNVDEKYYLSEKCINGFLAHAERHKNDGFKFSPTDGNVIANTILASSKCRSCDNFIKVIGNMYDCGKQAGRIYDSEGISPTLDNMASGGNKAPKIVEPLSCAMRRRDLVNMSDAQNGNATGQMLEIGDDKANSITTVQKDSMVVEPINPHTAKRLIKVLDNGKYVDLKMTRTRKDVVIFQIDNENSIASTVISAHIPKCYGESMEFRIRKLTPRETFRLMDMDDEDIDKLLNSGISNTQLYRMAGNSIVVSVLYHIFRKLFIEKENENQQLTLF